MTTRCQRPDWTPLAANANDNNHNLPSTNDVHQQTSHLGTGASLNDHYDSHEPIPSQDHHHHHHHQQQQVAPLASLDCSITESISTSNNNNHQVAPEVSKPPATNNPKDAVSSGDSCPDTPTLSDYFDCDHFSDMVDDSLFEITNAGCLSKSVFGPNNRQANRSSMVVVSGGQLIGGGRDDDQEDHRSGETTPTNEPNGRPLADLINQGGGGGQPEIEAASEQLSSPLQLINSKLAREADQTKGLVALMAHFQPYDYSSTSSVPGTGQLTRPARPKPPQPNPGDLVTSNSSAAVANQSEQPRTASRRKSRSNPDVQESKPVEMTTTTTSLKLSDSISGEEGAARGAKFNRPVVAGGVKRSKSSRDRLGLSSSSSSATCPICRDEQESSRKGRRRFTFSLFNLFTGAASDNDKNVCRHRQSLLGGDGGDQLQSDTNSMCQMKPHKQQHSSTRKHQENDNNNNKKPGGGRRALYNKNSGRQQQQQHQTGEPSLVLGPSQLKLRDSIRVTNQRKLRSGSASTLTGAKSGRPQQPDEILLDLSARPAKQPHNYDTSSALNIDNNNNNNCQVAPPGSGAVQPRARAASASVGRTSNGQSVTSAGRHNKSVKFTMPPDRVMIGVSKSQSTGRHLGSSSSASPWLPGANLQPSAPIIKQQHRPNVPKSSSYCQTDSTKTLDAMLARYEGNSMLIDEIIEKLKLGETIASNLSALDAEQQAVDRRPPPPPPADDDASKCPCNSHNNDPPEGQTSGGQEQGHDDNNQTSLIKDWSAEQSQLV